MSEQYTIWLQTAGGPLATTWPPATAWTAVTFQNSWTNVGSGYQTCQYRKAGDVVELRGSAMGGASGTVAFTLPVGFRSPLALELAVVGGGTNPRMAVNPNGTVNIYATPNVQIGGRFSTIA